MISWIKTSKPLILLFIFFLALSTGCSKKKEEEPKKPVGEFKTGGILNDSVLSSVTSFDPVKTVDVATLRIGQQFYQGLVGIDHGLKVVPLLAESWETEDNKTWLFHLRKGVRFQDDPVFQNGKGREVTAEDVKYSFQRLVDPKTKSVGSWIFSGVVAGAKEYFEGKAPKVTGFQALDDHTLKIELLKPFYPLLPRLSLYLTSIVPKEAVEKYGEDFGQHPVGTGPFMLSKLTPEEIVLKKNSTYWEKDLVKRPLPYLDGVNIRFVREEMSQWKEFDQGMLDITDIPTSVYPNVVDLNKALKGSYSKYQLKSAPAIEVQYYAFIMSQEPFDRSKALREAFNYAVDKESIVREVLKGRAVVAKGIIPPGLQAYNPDLKGYTYNKELGAEKLKEAGYPGGEGLPEFTLIVDPGVQTEAVASAIQSQLSEVGVKIKIQTVQFNTLLEMAATEKAPLFRLWFAASYPDPELLFIQFITGFHPPLGFNFARYSNPKFDELFNKATSATTEAERIKYYREAEKTAVRDAPWIFLYHSEAAILLQPYVKNYMFNGLQLKTYKYVWLDK